MANLQVGLTQYNSLAIEWLTNKYTEMTTLTTTIMIHQSALLSERFTAVVFYAIVDTNPLILAHLMLCTVAIHQKLFPVLEKGLSGHQITVQKMDTIFLKKKKRHNFSIKSENKAK